MDRKPTGVTVRGNSVQIAFTYNGNRFREQTHYPPTKTGLKEASRKREAILYEIKAGIFDFVKHFPTSKNAQKFRKGSPETLTIEAALKAWLQRNQQRWEASTLRDYNSAVYYHLIPKFGSMVIADLTAVKIKEWLAGLAISNKRKNNIITPLRQMFEELYTDEFIDKNPLTRVKNLSAPPREPEPFNQDEIARILDQLNGQQRNLIQFAFASGLRTSELIALRWQDVDLENNRIYVRQAKVHGNLKTTKTKAGLREVELQSSAKEALHNQKLYTEHLSEWVFHDPRTDQPWKNDQAIRKVVWTPALKRAGIKYRSPYQTRHTFASVLLSAGDKPIRVAVQMGHSNCAITIQKYARWIP